MAISKSLLLTLTLSCLSSLSHAAPGVTTRYWDCCKPSCGWPRNTLSSPVAICDASDQPISDQNTANYCQQGGTAFSCSNQGPWAINNDLSYGFVAINPASETQDSWCCSCYQLTFTSGPVAGKQMIVQATNTGGDLGDNHFDIAMPGGGQGIYLGCSAQYGGNINWGDRYGGVHTREECDGLPERLRPGCYWRFDWFLNADNPNVEYTRVSCPAELSARSGCTRA